MSYILDALSKSQQARDLGRVPTLATQPLLRPRGAGSRSWGLATTALAGLAVAIALYAALRQAPEGPAPSHPAQHSPPAQLLGPIAGQPTPGIGPRVETTATLVHGGSQPTTEGQSAPQPVQPQPLKAPTPAHPAAGASTTASSTPPVDTPAAVAATPTTRPTASLSEVNPGSAPLKPRAHAHAQPASSTPIDEAEGGENGGLGEESLPSPPPHPATAAAPLSPAGVQGVPEDLRRDIESFKEQLKEGETDKAKAGKKAAAAPSVPTRERSLPREVEERLPRFLLTVHLFDADPSKRFVILDGRKTREGESSRNGILVQEVLPDGVILVFDGHPFFRPR